MRFSSHRGIYLGLSKKISFKLKQKIRTFLKKLLQFLQKYDIMIMRKSILTIQHLNLEVCDMNLYIANRFNLVRDHAFPRFQIRGG